MALEVFGSRGHGAGGGTAVGCGEEGVSGRFWIKHGRKKPQEALGSGDDHCARGVSPRFTSFRHAVFA